MTQDSVYLLLGRIEGKLDAVAASQLAITADHEALSDRVGRLERLYSRALGAGAAILALLSVFGDALRTRLGI